ncbi:unnamed protein product [marine sediment metagenome]|uniref:Uncharacterized protein n=1 Tax=marine sediment metagenome TaxID=412755 RepID=X1BQ88_9ZZZZ
MITPNFNLMLWILFILLILKGIAGIVLGAIGSKKHKEYGGLDMAAGIVLLVLLAFVAFT